MAHSAENRAISIMEKKAFKLDYESPAIAVSEVSGVEMGFCISGGGTGVDSDSNERYGSSNYTWE